MTLFKKGETVTLKISDSGKRYIVSRDQKPTSEMVFVTEVVSELDIVDTTMQAKNLERVKGRII